MNELSSHNTGAGKGDHDRSPGWRDHYSEIDWGVIEPEGFTRVGPGRLLKRYGSRPSAGVAVENWDTGAIESWPIIRVEYDAASVAALERATPQDGAMAPALPAVPEDKHRDSCCGRCGCGEKHN